VALAAVWTGARERAIGLDRVVHWMAEAPARLAGLPRKGALAVGRDADLVAFAPDETWTVGELAHRHAGTPYAGRSLTGAVRRTWLRGRPADGAPVGRLLRRGMPE
jgi:allantoinase